MTTKQIIEKAVQKRISEGFSFGCLYGVERGDDGTYQSPVDKEICPLGAILLRAKYNKMESFEEDCAEVLGTPLSFISGFNTAILGALNSSGGYDFCQGHELGMYFLKYIQEVA